MRFPLNVLANSSSALYWVWGSFAFLDCGMYMEEDQEKLKYWRIERFFSKDQKGHFKRLWVVFSKIPSRVRSGSSKEYRWLIPIDLACSGKGIAEVQRTLPCNKFNSFQWEFQKSLIDCPKSHWLSVDFDYIDPESFPPLQWCWPAGRACRVMIFLSASINESDFSLKSF